MAGNVTAILQAQQLNPLTPMAFLTPEAGYQTTIAAYGMVGSAGALIWDILSNINGEYKLLFRHKIGISTLVYFFSRQVFWLWACLNEMLNISYRLGVLVYVLMDVIFQTAPLSNCHVIRKTVCGLYHIAFSSTSLLFFLRVRAVFKQNKLVVAFFGFLWLSVLGASLTVVNTAIAVRVGPTKYCSAKNIQQYASAAPIAFAVNDTFVFVAISWRLIFNATRDGAKQGLKSMVRGEYLPTFSRALLKDGQVYYLYVRRPPLRTCLNLIQNLISSLAIVTWIRPTMFISYRLIMMFTVMNVTLTNMMACRVFRHTKFGRFTEDAGSSRWVASQLGQLDLEVGQGDVRSRTHFVSFVVQEPQAKIETLETEARWGDDMSMKGADEKVLA
ncbi:hypothetical protein DXG01_002052 [Tephrocybe rancida]|nr:hypothetical protein DXG01_002052 [Tephrocybe rancida]